MKTTLSLRQLVGRLGVLSVEGALTAPVAGLAYDPRRVVPGSVFFAVRGAGGQGEDDQAIPRAIERGATAIVGEQFGFMPYRASRIRVADCRRALAHAAAMFHGYPSRQLQVVVVSGGAARGAVAHLLYELLGSAGVATGLLGSLGCRLGERVLPPWAEEPEALDVQEGLAAVQRAGARACILEVSPAALGRGCLEGAEVEAAILMAGTAAAGSASGDGDEGREHPAGGPALAFRGGARSARGRAGGWWRLVNLKPGGAGRAEELAWRLERPTLGPMTLRATLGALRPSGTPLEATTPLGPLAVRLRFPGRPNAQAALAAAAIALALKIPLGAVATGLARASGVPGHLEPVRAARGYHVVVDGCSSAGELEGALRTLREFIPGRVLLLFGGGSRHAPEARAALGEVAARGADLTVLTSDNPGWEAPEAIAAQVASGYQRVRGVPPRIVADRSQAIREVLAVARSGDGVLLAGKGHRTVQEFAGCIQPFDDRAHARAILGGRTPWGVLREEVAA